MPIEAAVTAGRPRDDVLTDAILTAVLELVAEKGVAGMTTAAVARRAHTSKQALYRRWPTKPALIAAAVHRALASGNPTVPDHGGVRDDMVELFTNTLRVLGEGPLGAAVRALVGAMGDAELDAAIQAVREDRLTLMHDILRRGQARGEISAGRDIELDADLLLGAVYYRLLIKRESLHPVMAAEIVDAWWRGPQT